jgi:hypothetical protein
LKNRKRERTEEKFSTSTRHRRLRQVLDTVFLAIGGDPKVQVRRDDLGPAADLALVQGRCGTVAQIPLETRAARHDSLPLPRLVEDLATEKQQIIRKRNEHGGAKFPWAAQKL